MVQKEVLNPTRARAIEVLNMLADARDIQRLGAKSVGHQISQAGLYLPAWLRPDWFRPDPRPKEVCRELRGWAKNLEKGEDAVRLQQIAKHGNYSSGALFRALYMANMSISGLENQPNEAEILMLLKGKSPPLPARHIGRLARLFPCLPEWLSGYPLMLELSKQPPMRTRVPWLYFAKFGVAPSTLYGRRVSND